MTKTFLGIYRGATVYEVNEFKAADGVKLNSKVLAKAQVPGSGNLVVDFVATAPSREQALDKVKADIDRYLEEHDIDAFVIEQV